MHKNLFVGKILKEATHTKRFMSRCSYCSKPADTVIGPKGKQINFCTDHHSELAVDVMFLFQQRIRYEIN